MTLTQNTRTPRSPTPAAMHDVLVLPNHGPNTRTLHSPTLQIASTDAEHRLAELGLHLVAVTESDWEALDHLVKDLGAQGRWSRFHCGLPHLPERQARLLARAEPGRRVGYAAATPDGSFVAHAMLGMTAESLPEFAVMTASGWRHQGLARILGRLLATRSRVDGFPVWCADILGSNRAAFALMAQLGLLERRHFDGGSVHVHVALYPEQTLSDGSVEEQSAPEQKSDHLTTTVVQSFTSIAV